MFVPPFFLSFFGSKGKVEVEEQSRFAPTTLISAPTTLILKVLGAQSDKAVTDFIRKSKNQINEAILLHDTTPT